MRQALHAEWTKLRTAPGPGWLLLAAIALTVAVSAAAAAAVKCPSAACQIDPAKVSRTDRDRSRPGSRRHRGRAGHQRRVQHRHDPHTLAAMPRRWTVLAAKAAIVTGAS